MKTIQHSMAYQALREAGEDIKPEDVIIDHHGGFCEYRNKKYGILFPESYVQKIRALPKYKMYDYCFIGNKANHRVWVLDYNSPGNYIRIDRAGRTQPKNMCDTENYHNYMSQSKYTLCPMGSDANEAKYGKKCRWSYRFYEAILNMSIPILRDTNVFQHEPHEYTPEMVTHNYQRVLKKCCI